jgi:hypothetical protein
VTPPIWLDATGRGVALADWIEEIIDVAVAKHARAAGRSRHRLSGRWPAEVQADSRNQTG